MENLLMLRSEEGLVTTAKQLADNIYLLIEEQHDVTPHIYEVYMDNEEFIKLVTWIEIMWVRIARSRRFCKTPLPNRSHGPMAIVDRPLRQG